KVDIVSDKPQTTRHRILGVRHSAAGQMVFIDTPGIHKPVHRMNQQIIDATVSTLRDADLVVLVVDVSVPPGTGDRFVQRLVESAGTPAIVALNKIDQVKKEELLPDMASYGQGAVYKA